MQILAQGEKFANLCILYAIKQTCHMCIHYIPFVYLPVEQNVKSFLSFYPSLQEFKIWLVGQGILCHINDVGQNKVQVNKFNLLWF